MNESVAVVGFSCRFPGAGDADAFWQLLVDGREALTRFTDEELAQRGVPTGLRRNPAYVPVGGLLADQDRFDPAPFGMSRTEAELLDPQQRVFLECAWHALEHAGLARGAGVTGVFAGAALSAYLATNLAHRFDPLGGADPAGSLQLHTGNVADYLPLRTAHRLGLEGPAVAVGATCATSLVAVHIAVQALLAGECDTALAGGVSLRVPQGLGYLHVPDGPFSADGHTRPYSAQARGTVFTQGAGVVVLRRLSDALADGDHVHAVVLGSAVGNDGADRAGFTAPSSAGQARTIAEALAVGDVDPRSVSYVEGHGTGTILGDPIEVQALRRVFGDADRPWCGLGSVKGNIGHADSAAGIAGFLKVVQALRNRTLPASLHAHPVNPEVGLEGSAFRIVDRTERWETERVRRAGVSSFGIGGVNCHVVLEEAPVTPEPDRDERAQVLVVSSATAQACRATARALSDAVTSAPVADVAHTLTRRRQLAARAAVTVAPGEDVAEALRRAVVVEAAGTPPRVVFAFPGGGAQYAGMAEGPYRDEQVFTSTVDELAEFLLPLSGADVRDVLLDPVATAAARSPRRGLPALFTACLATARLLESWGVRPDVVLGHSVGEYAAAVVAGVLSWQDAALLVAERSRLMEELPQGAMLSVPLGEADVRDLLAAHPALDLAAINASDSCAVSGPSDAITVLRDVLAARGVESHVVGVDVAAHSRLVESAMPALRAVAARLTAAPATIPLVTTLTGQVATGAALADPEHWVRHLRGTVRFADALDTALGDGDPVLVQVGPGGMIASLAARHESVRAAVTTFPRAGEGTAGRAALLDAAGTLWAHGVPVDLTATHRGRRTRVPLPGYAFQRERFWIEPQRTRTGAVVGPVAAEPDVAEPLQLPSWRRLPPLAPVAALANRRWAVLGDGHWADALRAALPVVDGDADAVIAVHSGTSLHDEVLAYGRLDGTPLVQLTVRGERVIGDEVVDPVAAGVRGLPRVLAQEVPGLRWRTLDLPDDEPGEAGVAAVLAETADLLATPDGGAWELALRAGQRWIRQWEPWQPNDTEDLPSDPVVVVTGGSGNVARALADALHARGSARVVLASRSTTPSVDVTDADQLRALLADVADQHGTIDLVVHAPVVIELAALSEMDDQVVADALAPKVTGALNLRSAVEALPPRGRPRAVVLMSSAAGTIGGFGLGAYVAASRFLDGFAAGGTPGTTWVAIDWDRWRFGTAQEHEAAAEITMRHALDAADAVRALLRVAGLALAGTVPHQVAVSPAELNTRSLAIGARQTRAESGGDAPATAEERLVAEVLGEALGRPVTSRDDDFFALGGHSLLATRVLARLRDDHGVELRLRDLLARPTVAGLAELITTTTGPARREEPAAAPVAAGEPFPLTRVQHAYWVGRSAAFALGEVGCHFYLEHDCAELDHERYQNAWNRLIERHEMLRCVVGPDGHNVVLTEVPRYRVPVHELSDADELEALRARLSHRVADPGRWPLIEAHVVRMPGGRHRVLVSVDVLVCDSASYLILDRELRALYENPQAELPPIGTTFAECARAMDRRRGDTEHRRAAEYWLRRVDALPVAPPLPLRESEGAPRFARRSARLAAPLWNRVREQAGQMGVTPTAVLLTAYADVLAAWSRTDHFCLTLTVFDRPDVHPDVDRVVGEFSSLLLFEADHRGLATFAERAKAAQHRLFDDLDHRSFSGLEVLTEQARRTGRQQNVPVVFTGMLGLDRLGGEPHDHEWLGPVDFGVSQTPQVWLDHQAYEHRGALVLQWDVAETSLDAEEADTAFTAYVTWLTALAESGDAWTGGEAGPMPHGEFAPSPSEDEHVVGAADDDASTGGDAASGESQGDHVIDVLTGIWAELLDLEPGAIPADVSFLGLGGDSLLVVRMASIIRQKLDVVLALTEIRAELTLTDLVELVRRRGEGGAARRALDVTVRRRFEPAEPFGLLPLQQAYFVGQQGEWELSYSSAHVCTDIALSDVDAERAPAALADALRRVIAHQPMLRVRITPDGTQRILAADDPQTAVVPEVCDLRDANDDVVAVELDRIRAEMSLRGPDPATGPPLEMRLTLLPGGRARLHTAFSLLAVDGWSGGVFDRELLTYVADPNAVLPPLLVDFGDYATALEEVRGGEQWRADHEWWSRRLPQLPAAPALPMIADPDGLDVTAMAAREARLVPSDWSALRERCAEHEVTPTAAVLAVYAIALARLAGGRRFLLNSLQAGRLPLHPDVDRMIGAFSSTALLSIDLPHGGRLADLAAAVRGEITESLAHNLVSGVEVSRELARHRGTHRPVAPVVFQSTIGMDAALGGERPLTAGPLGRIDISDYVQHIRTPQVFLELRVFELRGELVLNFAVVEELFGTEVVDRLFGEVVGTVRELAAGLGWDDVVELPADTGTGQADEPTTERGRVEPGAPRDELERRIAALWADLLGVSEVDRSDEFFALGGDSLLAVRMLGRLAREHGSSAQPRAFLAAPTPAGLAAAVRADEPVPVADIAVPLRDGDGPPLFLLHPSGGDVLCYADLARRISAPNPVIALADPGLSGHGGPESIAAMVEQYLAVLRAHQPHGPYLLGGWSMGGTVGHQLACALRERGERVALLVMIDSNSPERIVAIEGLDRQRTDDEVRLRYLRSVEAYLDVDCGTDHGADELERALAERGVTVTPARYAVFARHLRGLASHHASPLDAETPVLLLRAGRTSPRNARIGMGVDDAFDEHDLGWSGHVAGEFRVVEVDAHHYSILGDPAVKHVADAISSALARIAKES
ncbi:type I polyketide synthase [Saccharothrix deserti]|uniref:type I polyketide synthase n=1 Tax=Saccharothrix deserti TaxID=2593674 RepID=UPI00131D92C7|nr:type I polyketide synthase [Saccharothrix deserti]